MHRLSFRFNTEPLPFYSGEKGGHPAREPGEFELRKAEYPDGTRLQNGAVARLQASGRRVRHFVQTEGAGERGRRPFSARGRKQVGTKAKWIPSFGQQNIATHKSALRYWGADTVRWCRRPDLNRYALAGGGF